MPGGASHPVFRDSRAGPSRGEGCNETRRQAELMILALPALFLRAHPSPWILPAIGGALLFWVIFFSPRLLPGTYRPAEIQAGYSPGKIAYAAMVLVLLLLFRGRLFVAAGAWAVMAFGDGAATLAGRRWGGAPVPWNRKKTLAGSLAFVLAGALACAALLKWVNYPLGDFTVAFCLMAGLLAAGAGALVESLPLPVDDNVSVPVTAAAVLAAFSHPILLEFRHLAE